MFSYDTGNRIKEVSIAYKGKARNNMITTLHIDIQKSQIVVGKNAKSQALLEAVTKGKHKVNICIIQC